MLQAIDRGQRDRKCICGIVRIDLFRDVHHSLHHFYDLLLVSAAIAGQLLLHLQRRHRDDGNVLAIACEQDHTARLRHLDARRNIRIEIKCLYPHERRPICRDELGDAFVNDVQPLEVTLVFVRLNDAVVDRSDGGAILLNHTEAAAPGTGVNA